MNDIVYLNGEYLSRDEAKISPDDRGFIFSDGVYEVVKYYNGNPFRLQSHLDRLNRSLTEIHLSFDITGLEKMLGELLIRNNLEHTQAAIYWQITRGVHNRIHHFPENIEPSIYAFAFHFPSFVENLEKGIRVITHEDIRWQRCDIKSISLLANTMLYNQAVQAGAGECVLIRDRVVTEATHSSVLAVKYNRVITHPLTNQVLPGITRQVIKEICLDHRIDFIEETFTENELYQMDELIIAGTGSEITPAVYVNDKIIGDGIPGPLTRFLQEEFFKLT